MRTIVKVGIVILIILVLAGGLYILADNQKQIDESYDAGFNQGVIQIMAKAETCQVVQLDAQLGDEIVTMGIIDVTCLN